MQAIANTAGFHFAYIEQGGSSLYSTMALKASSLEALLIVVSIGGVETNHFSLWHDKAGNAVNQPLAGVVDPVTGLTFPNLNAHGGEATQTNLILPEPTQFLRNDLPACSVVRPALDQNAGAVATIRSFTADKLFDGQPPKFLRDGDAAGPGRRRRPSPGQRALAVASEASPHHRDPPATRPRPIDNAKGDIPC
jgi:hypothetical protein